MKIKISGVNSTIVALKNQLKQKTAQHRRKVMGELVTNLKSATPVDTGEARDGWKIEGNSIVNDVEHLKYLNEGSSTQAPTHFIESTVLQHRDVRPSGIIVNEK